MSSSSSSPRLAVPDVCTKVSLVLTLLVAGATFIMSIVVHLAVGALQAVIESGAATNTTASGMDATLAVVHALRKRQDGSL